MNPTRPGSNISLTPSDPTRHRDSHVSQSPTLSDSPRDHNLLKLATKNRSRVNLLSKSQQTQGRRSMGEGSTSSVADVLADTNAVSIPAAAGFAFTQLPRPLSQQLAVPHSGNTLMPTPVPEEGENPLDTAALGTVSNRLLPYADPRSSAEEAISRRVSRRSTARLENPVQQERPHKSQRGIKGFCGFVKSGFKKLPSKLRNGIAGLIRSQKVLRCWEHGRASGKRKGKEREVVPPELEASQEKNRQPTTTGAAAHVAPVTLPLPGAPSPVVASPLPPSLPTEPATPVASTPSPHIAGPAEEVFHGAATGQELDRQQLDVNSTQQISEAVRNAMSEAWAQLAAPVIVAMRIPM